MLLIVLVSSCGAEKGTQRLLCFCFCFVVKGQNAAIGQNHVRAVLNTWYRVPLLVRIEHQVAQYHQISLAVTRREKYFFCGQVSLLHIHIVLPPSHTTQALSYDAFWMVLVGRTLIGFGGARGVNRRYIADTIPIASR